MVWILYIYGLLCTYFMINIICNRGVIDTVDFTIAIILFGLILLYLKYLCEFQNRIEVIRNKVEQIYNNFLTIS